MALVLEHHEPDQPLIGTSSGVAEAAPFTEKYLEVIDLIQDKAEQAEPAKNDVAGPNE